MLAGGKSEVKARTPQPVACSSLPADALGDMLSFCAHTLGIIEHGVNMTLTASLQL
jgi:hypothetical protein